eukprot:TRINITY_DN9620_c0_g1_i2.p1 TRINITY_DN9620_c0_g1~~TRINITY_DN9620_c0_g1_i2.p1  ORF type:complete len:131 (+),score=4.90 TRINITY_DN9620_c0_g1_i2:36-428(+)
MSNTCLLLKPMYMTIVQDLESLLREFKNSSDTLIICCATLTIVAPPRDGLTFGEYVKTLVQVLHGRQVIGAFAANCLGPAFVGAFNSTPMPEDNKAAWAVKVSLILLIDRFAQAQVTSIKRKLKTSPAPQ